MATGPPKSYKLVYFNPPSSLIYHDISIVNILVVIVRKTNLADCIDEIAMGSGGMGQALVPGWNPKS